nr:MAG TPA: repressor domain protein [Caudoviricetes sp.]
MNELKIFNNAEFGQVRTVEVEGKIYFVASDVARALGYSNTRDAIARHCKGVVKHDTPTSGGIQSISYIPEGDMYRLITHSKLESAERFEGWVFDEVLPSLRKTGSYEVPKKEKQDKSNRLPLSSVNMMVKNVMSTLEKAKVEPVFVAAEVKRLYTDLGYEVKAPLITDKENMPKLYDCTEIGKELGIYSNTGKPHNQAVSAIIKKLHIPSSEIVTTAFSRNGHDDVTAQYKPSVLEDVKLWLAENNYPTRIPYVDSRGNQKTCTVVYREAA